MARYIDVEPLEDKLKEHIRKTESELMLGALSTFMRLLDITPTADVAPVRHGRWVVIDAEEPRRYGCSECKRLSWNMENYCGNCGAKMDEGGTDGTDDC